MAIRLRQAGFEDFVVLERGDRVGGTWARNTYPGCACDLPALLYSFSFEVKADWSRPYAPQPEILAYMQGCAEKYGVLPHCRFGAEVTGAAWDEARSLWRVSLASGERIEAEVVVGAIGMFNELVWPEIDGLAGFRGEVIHSAQWDAETDLSGLRVGVIGSAASAVQIVPKIAKRAARVHLFQRTANWVMPKEDDPLSAEDLERLRGDPAAVAALRQLIFDRVDAGMTFSDPAAVAEIEASVLAAIEVVEDPEVRHKLRPQHPFGCKRPLLSNDFYASFNRPNLELVTETIERVTEHGLRTADGVEREVDVLIVATGFQATRFLSVIDVRGRGGQPLEDAWRDGAHAYLGVTTAGFPNCFMLYGPNTNNGSILHMIECQVEHVLLHLERLRDEALAWVDVRTEAMERYNEGVQEGIAGVRAWQADCNGYYRSPSGRVVTQWPDSMTAYRERTRQIDPDAFDAVALAESK